MELLLVFNNLNIGGIENRILDIINVLGKHHSHIKVTLCLKQNTGPLLTRLPKSVRLIYPPTTHPLFFPFWLSFQISRLHPDKILAFGNYSAICSIFGKIFSFSHTQVIISEDSSIQKQIQQDSYSSFRKLLVIFLYPFAHKIIVLSPAGYQNIIKLSPLVRNKTIVSPIWLPHFFPHLKTPIHHHSYDLLFLGRFVPQKNPLRFISIIKQVSRHRPNINCAMVGLGSLQKQMENYIKKLNLSENIRLYPATTDVAGFYSRSKLFLLTSRHEGFPVVLLESSASYCLPISPSLPEISDYYSHHSSKLLYTTNRQASNLILSLLSQTGLRNQIANYYHRLCLHDQKRNSKQFINLILN